MEDRLINHMYREIQFYRKYWPWLPLLIVSLKVILIVTFNEEITDFIKESSTWSYLVINSGAIYAMFASIWNMALLWMVAEKFGRSSDGFIFLICVLLDTSVIYKATQLLGV